MRSRAKLQDRLGGVMGSARVGMQRRVPAQSLEFPRLA
jgi:hypothetical protein